MKCLVTAGNTLAPLDSVRGITNIFSGRTGTQIALQLYRNSHDVVLLTSRPEAIQELTAQEPLAARWQVRTYRLFDELQQQMKELITQGNFNTLIHSAAVSDYLSAGVFTSSPGTQFDGTQKQWHSTTGPCQLIDVAAGKVKSSHEELWIRMIKAPKLIDQVRSPWGFTGKLVKFKLEVGVDRPRLEAIAESSRLQSNADLMVANTLEGMHDWAILGPLNGDYVEVPRADLAHRIVLELESS
ncbi:MAG TPA: phosphopantothenoylcysteine decarboxylase [Gemmatales bacterium]|nr:phosphopantothenoylcysteine decarboxylase [Gemmatales bacterium]